MGHERRRGCSLHIGQAPLPHWALAQAQGRRSHWPGSKKPRHRHERRDPIGQAPEGTRSFRALAEGGGRRAATCGSPGQPKAARGQRGHAAPRVQAGGLFLEEGGRPRRGSGAAGARAPGRCLVRRDRGGTRVLWARSLTASLPFHSAPAGIPAPSERRPYSGRGSLVAFSNL